MENLKESHMRQRKGCSLILFPLPLQGHINPMLQLANILYTKGFSIIVIHTNFNSPNPSKYPHFTFHSIPNSMLENEEASTVDILHLVTVLNTKYVRSFQDTLAKLVLEKSKEEAVACLITDADWYFAQDVADSMRIHRLVLRTSNISSFLVFAAFPLLQEKGYFPVKESEEEEAVVELPPLKVKDLPQIKTRNISYFYQVIGGLVNQSRTSSGIIWNSFEELEQDDKSKLCHQFPIPIFTIGPFHKYFSAHSSSLLTLDQTCISWLDNHAPNSVLYVSFGSLVTIEEDEFLEIAWGLANSNQPFLWVVRPGLVQGAEWLEPLPEGFLEKLGGRGHIVKWAPQQEVLAHRAIGGFWTHNGWNSTLESICEGVPMICHPTFGDQKVNSCYVTNVWKIGLGLGKKMKRGEIEKTIRRLLVEEEGQEIKKRIISLKEKAELCLRKGGSSYQSLENLTSYILSFLHT